MEELQKEIVLLKERISILENESKLLERDYQKHLTKLLKASHLKNKFGVTDITTDNCHIEIKTWSNYKNALGQLISYNLGNPKEKLVAAFFGNIIFKERAIELMHDNKIDVWELNIINNELFIEKHPYNTVVKYLLLQTFTIGGPKDFVKLKDIKSIFKENGIIEKNIEKVINIVEKTFKGVCFKPNTRVNNISSKKIFLGLTYK